MDAVGPQWHKPVPPARRQRRIAVAFQSTSILGLAEVSGQHFVHFPGALVKKFLADFQHTEAVEDDLTVADLVESIGNLIPSGED